ncbi:MAG: hypothetical protein K2I77_03185 [Anaeroplasmataceae bacterium]|nr:hypothetical protein [Anaeroplasmataceae bacterium]
MKKLLRGMSIAFAFVMLLVLVSCKGGNISKSYADKINKAAEEGNYITLEEVEKALGDYAQVSVVAGYGTVSAVKGYKASEDEKFMSDLLKKPDKKISIITITIADGNATAAVFKSGTILELAFEM